MEDDSSNRELELTNPCTLYKQRSILSDGAGSSSEEESWLCLLDPEDGSTLVSLHPQQQNLLNMTGVVSGESTLFAPPGQGDLTVMDGYILVLKDPSKVVFGGGATTSSSGRDRRHLVAITGAKKVTIV